MNSDAMMSKILGMFFGDTPDLVDKASEILGKKAKANDTVAKQILAFQVYSGKDKVKIFKILLESINKDDTFLLPYFDFFIWTYAENEKVYNDYCDFAISELKKPEIAESIKRKLMEQEAIAKGSLVAKSIIQGQ